MRDSVQTHALRLAAQRLGGLRELREHLDASTVQLLRWMTGREQMPASVFSSVVAVVLQPFGDSESNGVSNRLRESPLPEARKLP
jgi:hypothetical protein